MAYSKDYFRLQLNFAQKASDITGQGMDDILLVYTSFYKTFRIEGWDFNPGNPTWKKFLAKFNRSSDSLSAIYQFYLEQIRLKGEKNEKELFGCFSYEYYEKKKAVSIHFRNVDEPEPGALSKKREKVRRSELNKMFKAIKKKYPDAKKVVGFSWLYNLEAYKRLFPPEYMKSYKIGVDWFKSTALWGQFLDSAGEIKEKLASDFEKCVSNKMTMEETKDCFPFKLIEPKANIEYFYSFYGITKEKER